MDASPGPEALLSTKELSRHSGIPEGTLRYWRACGEGPPSFTLGRKRVMYRWSTFKDWIASQEAATSRGGAA